MDPKSPGRAASIGSADGLLSSAGSGGPLHEGTAGLRMEDDGERSSGSDVAEGEQEPRAEKPATEAAAGADEDAATAAAYGEAKARALLRQFREDTGRDAETPGELAEWIVRRIR